MRLALIAALLLPAATAAFGRETAYQALRAISAQRSKALLNSVVEVKGKNGAPQPATWVILLNDPAARGGIREIEVAKNQITSERTPVKEYSGQPEGAALDFAKLNLDSDGAFTVAEAEARSAKIGFFSVDYLLRHSDNGAPVWIIELLDEQKNTIGSITIAANTGTVLSKTIEGQTTKGSWAAGGGLKGRLIRFSDATGQTLQHAGQKLREFWDGQ